MMTGCMVINLQLTRTIDTRIYRKQRFGEYNPSGDGSEVCQRGKTI